MKGIQLDYDIKMPLHYITLHYITLVLFLRDQCRCLDVDINSKEVTTFSSKKTVSEYINQKYQLFYQNFRSSCVQVCSKNFFKLQSIKLFSRKKSYKGNLFSILATFCYKVLGALSLAFYCKQEMCNLLRSFGY